MVARLADAMFPPRCASCARGPWPFCPGCAASLVAPPEDMPPAGVDAVVAPYAYEGAVRRAVLNLKFSRSRATVDALAGPMAEALEGHPDAPSVADVVITWAPLGRRRRRERGFDQGRLLARAVGTRVGLPVRHLLDRTRETAPQARRGAADRRAAMDGAFVARRPAPPTILLVDDVVTTGATVAACAAALRAAGARRIVVLAAARAVAHAGAAARSYTPDGPASGSVVARGAAPR